MLRTDTFYNIDYSNLGYVIVHGYVSLLFDLEETLYLCLLYNFE